MDLPNKRSSQPRQFSLQALGLGVHPREERIKSIKEILALPASVIPVACISIGHPGESKEPHATYNSDLVVGGLHHILCIRRAREGNGHRSNSLVQVVVVVAGRPSTPSTIGIQNNADGRPCSL